MGKIYMTACMKGGCAKTVTTYNLAYSLHELGKKVLCVDFDSQANLSTCFGVEDTATVPVTIGHLMMAQIEDEELPAAEEYIQSRNGVDFISSSMVLSAVDLKLNHLIQPFKNLMDKNKIALLAAVDVSYLTEKEQQMLWNIVERQGLKVKPVYAEKLRKASGNLTEEKMAEILEALQVKHKDSNAGVNFRLPKSICSKYFDGMDSKQMASVVEQALAAWFERKETAVV